MVNDFIVPDTVKVKNGFVDVVADLRGSHADGAVGGYMRYTCLRVFVEEGSSRYAPRRR